MSFVGPVKINRLIPRQTSTMIRRMFIRTKHDPKLNWTRVQIVESVRTGKKVRHPPR